MYVLAVENEPAYKGRFVVTDLSEQPSAALLRDGAHASRAPAGIQTARGVLWEDLRMPELDLAKLKRLQGAVSSALDRVPEKSAHGLPPTYNTLRGQVIDAVPDGLKHEVTAIAPEVVSTAHGVHAVIERSQDGATAYARLAALKGWLDALIDPKQG